MTAFSITRPNGKRNQRKCRQLKPDGTACLGSASRVVWILEDALYVCPKHAAEMESVWDEALDQPRQEAAA
jgi:hypothetical protein